MRIVGNPPSGGKKPTTPTIGTATDGGTGTTVSVAFTPSTYIGKSTITYTATSSPGGLTGTSSGSPITVSGLTTGTAYTFTVVGTTNYGVSSAASAASNSVTPASPTSFESIASTVCVGTENTVTFSGIPGTYKMLQIRFMARSTQAALASNLDVILNGVNASPYYATHTLSANGSTVTGSNASSTSELRLGTTTAYPIPGANAAANIYGVGVVDIIDYASTTKNKTAKSFSGYTTNGASTGYINYTSGLFVNTSAVTSVTLDSSSNFAAGSVLALYGIK